jgi:hypothetical protein
MCGTGFACYVRDRLRLLRSMLRFQGSLVASQGLAANTSFPGLTACARLPPYGSKPKIKLNRSFIHLFL